jgi:hypothetical protein
MTGIALLIAFLEMRSGKPGSIRTQREYRLCSRMDFSTLHVPKTCIKGNISLTATIAAAYADNNMKKKQSKSQEIKQLDMAALDLLN